MTLRYGVGAIMGFILGVFLTMSMEAVQQVWQRLDRIESYLGHVSQILGSR